MPAIVLILLLQLIPKTWDDRELAAFEMPLVHREASAKHIPAEYYYRIPVRKIYKSYPIYAPAKEPPNYMQWLEQQEPQLAKEDGESVFDAPIGYGATFKLSQVRDPLWYERHHVPITRDGLMPFSRYVVRRKGTVEVGSGGCLMCHARVMPDGALLKGAQGNFPVDRVIAD